MRRRTRSKILLGALVCTGVAMWFLYDVLSGPGDYMTNLKELYDSPPMRDRWAAIKGDAVVQTLDDDVAFEDDNNDDDEDTAFHMEAPPESKAFAEQKAVEELIKRPQADGEDKEKREGQHGKRRRRREKHLKHQHPKVDEDDQTTVAVTVSTTEGASTTEASVKANTKDAHVTGHHAHIEAPEHISDHAQERARTEEHARGHAYPDIHDKEHPQHRTRVGDKEQPEHVQHHVAPEQHAEEHVQHHVAPEQHAEEHVQHHGLAEQHAQDRGQHHGLPEQHAQDRVQHHAHPHDAERQHTTHGAKSHEHEHKAAHKIPDHIQSEGERTTQESAAKEQTEQVAWTPEQVLAQIPEGENATGGEPRALEQSVGRMFETGNQTNMTSGYHVSTMIRGELKPTNLTLQSQMMQQLPEAPKKKSDRVNWEKFFSFIPNGLQSCTELFPNLDSQNPLPQDFQQAYIEFENILRHFQIKDNNIAEHLEQFIVYYFLVRAPFVKTVCETGFGAGHSAFLWLQANPDVKVYMFDLGIHEYSGPIADYLSAKFPGRLQVIWGDSVNTLPMFRQANKDVTCDIVVIDGGHTFRESFADYFHLRQMVTINNIVLLDNYPDISKNYMEILGAVWEGGKRRGEINEIFHCDYRPQPHGFSVGRFIPYSLTLPESRR